jgi:hypothetical protein
MKGIANKKGQAQQRPVLRIASKSDNRIIERRKACLTILNGDMPLIQREGQFLGSMAFCPDPFEALSPKQQKWLVSLIEKAGLPPLSKGGDHE